jgi:hypothetical protein
MLARTATPTCGGKCARSAHFSAVYRHRTIGGVQENRTFLFEKIRPSVEKVTA